MSLRIRADENMPGLEPFAKDGDLETAPGRAITRASLRHTDVLLVRSVTRVDGDLLAGTGVGFVGSATIGTDHVDQASLAEQGIAFAHAPGCNAMAVAEYDLQAVLDWLVEGGREPADTTVAVIGCGHVGMRAAQLFRAAGMTLWACDPPRERAGETLPGVPVILDQALAADVITLHVPLTRVGTDATFHMLNKDRLECLGSDQLLLNTSRGPVIDNAALLRRLNADGPATVLDVWENEPAIDPALFRRCRLGTPHVAGYSREGKLRGTAQLYQAFCDWLGRSVDQACVMPPDARTRQSVENMADLLMLLRSRYDLRRDHAGLRAALDESDPPAAFDALRRDYPVRHECAGLQVEGRVTGSWRPLLTALGVVQAS